MTPAEREALSLLNNSRIDHGLNVLKRGGILSMLARRHSAKMARTRDLFHTHDLSTKLEDAGLRWSWWGENAGVTGGGVAGLHKGFMASPEHKLNILGWFKRAGVGIVERDGLLWETVIFFR